MLGDGEGDRVFTYKMKRYPLPGGGSSTQIIEYSGCAAQMGGFFKKDPLT